MSGGYRVDLGRMGSLITTLEQAKERMTNANNALKNSSPSDMGSRDIDSAGGEFQDRWEFGIGKIAEFSGTVAEGLSKAKQVYAEMEQSVIDALGQGQSEQPAPPPAAAPQARQSEIGDRLGGQKA
ncbi:hypothetical protein [Amycolatopsis sp. H20-H5]|uniref:hypothetical protein n=1 Tax=Amycolatopsis sp. H20-H5 TaxID=3046309 RepID=UPI002DB7011F|nr:hypothetical protein [Amycolatopsis sp. H20-H5]MEC3978189.1 hypothetical protein [Amycolatopsis sp. H20-H5]